MAFELVNLGASANDRTGDNLRSGGAKINAIISYLNGNSAERFDTTNSSKTLTANSQIFADTSSNPITLTLPTVVSLGLTAVGTFIEVIDVAGTFGTNNLTFVTTDGALIQRVASPHVIAVAGQNTRLAYSGSTYGWVIV